MGHKLISNDYELLNFWLVVKIVSELWLFLKYLAEEKFFFGIRSVKIFAIYKSVNEKEKYLHKFLVI